LIVSVKGILNMRKSGKTVSKSGPGPGGVRLAAIAAALCACLAAAALSGCAAKAKTYTIMAEGAALESGVICYAGLEMNVYRDFASNPCGDCEDQPVSVYVGATADEVISAMAKAVSRADDLWAVREAGGGALVLEEKEAGSVDGEPLLTGVDGLTLAGDFGAAKPAGEDQGSAAEAAPGERLIRHIDGDEISVPVYAERLGAVYGPSYEALVVLGAEDRIVVRADVQTENFPWAELVFPRISQIPMLKNVHASVNTEELKTYMPDLVFTFSRPNELRQFKAAGIPCVWGLTPSTPDGTKEQLMVYAEALGGDAIPRAAHYAAYFDEKFAMVKSVTDNIPPVDRPTVYFAGIDMLTTYGKYSDIGAFIEAAGGKALTAGLEAGNHVQIDFEQLAAWNPAYIFIDHGAMNERAAVEEIMAGAYGSARYQSIDAVKNRRVYLVPSGVYYWDMGLQKILLLMYMAKTLHPAAFADLDPEAEVMEFYSEFFDYPLTREQSGRILGRLDP
jgi:iron complex transport system substrate-binding protein